jgi:hypothetical protein
MLRRFFLSTLAPLAFAAPLAEKDGWDKVMHLNPGTEVRVTKIGARFGIVAKHYETTEDSVIITTKTEQISVPKDQIARIEFVPGPATFRSTRSSTVDNNPVDREAARPKPGPGRTPGPTGSTSTTYTRTGKPSYELLWTRPRGN